MKMKKNQKKEEGDKSLFWRMSLLILSSSIFTTMVLIISCVTMRSSRQDLVGSHNNIHGGQAGGHHDEDGGNRSSSDGDDQQRLKLVPVRFYLKQHNLNWLEQRLYEISDPDHTDYGQWLTLEELSSHLASTAPVPSFSLEDEEEKSKKVQVS